MAVGPCTDIPSKLRIVLSLQSTDCPSPIADFAVASANQKNWTTILEQGTNPLIATLTCNDGSGGPDLTLAITTRRAAFPRAWR